MNYVPNSTHLVEILPADYLVDLKRNNTILEDQIKALAKVSFHGIAGTGHGRPGPWDMWVTVTVKEGSETTVECLYDGRKDIDEEEKIDLMGQISHERYRGDALKAVLEHLRAQSQALNNSFTKKHGVGDIITSSSMDMLTDVVNKAFGEGGLAGSLWLGSAFEMTLPTTTTSAMLLPQMNRMKEQITVHFESMLNDAALPEKDMAADLLDTMVSISSQDVLELKAAIQARDTYTADELKKLMQGLLDINAELDHIKTSVNESLEHLIAGITP